MPAGLLALACLLSGAGPALAQDHGEHHDGDRGGDYRDHDGPRVGFSFGFGYGGGFGPGPYLDPYPGWAPGWSPGWGAYPGTVWVRPWRPAYRRVVPAPVAPAVPPPPDMAIAPRQGQSAAQTEADRQDCNRFAVTQPAALADARIFQNTVAACLQARGYAVR
ncbi:MAG: hypothetical protein KGJ24_11190 [Burkholderiales bacterium]|nr:hypothetical protein [Burkholderiales bacterium]